MEKGLKRFKFGLILIAKMIISCKDPIKITIYGFYHVYGGTKCFKIVNKVTVTILALILTVIIGIHLGFTTPDQELIIFNWFIKT